MLNPKGAALSPLSLRPRWEALCAVPRADMHKQNPTLENIIFSPHATLFLLLHTGQAVFTEHPLACEASPPNVRKIQIHSYQQTLPAAPLLHLHDNGPLIIGPHTPALPFRGPLLFSA